MDTCIYCPSQRFTEEHPLPAGLGEFEGYVSLKDRVCDGCNRVCGKLDEQLCRSGPEAFFRTFIGVKGRKKHKTKVNPFYRGSAGGGRLEMRATNQNTGQNVLVELLSDQVARELRCVQLIAEDDSIHVITIHDKMTPAEFRKIFDSFGIKRFKQGIFYAAPEEQAWIESLLATVKWEHKTAWARPAGPIIYGPSVVKFELTSRYFRAIAKIGFHYFLTKVPQFRGDESCFADIRAFIMTDKCPVDECRRFVSYSGQSVAGQLRAGAQLTCWGHLLAAEVDYLRLSARVELFAGPGKRPLSYLVKLGGNPSRLDYNEAYADFFEYFPKDQRTHFDGVVSPLTAVTPGPQIAIPILPPMAHAAMLVRSWRWLVPLN